jgi:hypothetical protein
MPILVQINFKIKKQFLGSSKETLVPGGWKLVFRFTSVIGFQVSANFSYGPTLPGTIEEVDWGLRETVANFYSAVKAQEYKLVSKISDEKRRSGSLNTFVTVVFFLHRSTRSITDPRYRNAAK